MKQNYIAAILLSLISLNSLSAQNQNYLMDTSFGTKGYTFIPTTMPKVLSVDLFSGSKIRLTGHNSTLTNNDGHKTIQLLNTGLLDTSFSGDGIESGSPTFFSKNSATAINNNSEMMIIGREYNGDFEYKIIKLKNNGTSDLNFGNSGSVTSVKNGLTKNPGFIVQVADGSYIFNNVNDYTTSIYRLSANGATTSVLHNSYAGSSNDFQSYCKTKSGKILFAGTSFSTKNNLTTNMFHFLNADGSSSKLVYQDDNQTIGSQTTISCKFDEVNQIFVVLKNYYSSSSDARYHIKTFDAEGNFIAKYTYRESDFECAPLKTLAIDGFTYVLGVDRSFNLKISKINKNGEFDLSFGNNGIATIDITEDITKIDSVTSDNANSIFVASGNMSSTTSAFVMKINLSNTLGTKDFASNEDSFLFPNPTKGIINFKEKADRVVLFDINGKMLKDFKEVDNADFSEFQNGIYFLNFTIDGKSSTKKIILKK